MITLAVPFVSAIDEPPEGIEWPRDETVVLLNRELRPDTDISALSRFGDDVWYLTPAIFEDSATSRRIDFTTIPAPWRRDVKYYFWQLINYKEGRRVPNARGGGWPSPNTISLSFPGLRDFVKWLHAAGATTFAQVTHRTLNSYLTWVIAQKDDAYAAQYARILEVRRLWAYRPVLPARMRLPAGIPWDGEEAADLLGRLTPKAENRRVRIKERTMQSLLAWSIRFVEDYADDIVCAYHEYTVLSDRGRKHAPGARSARRSGTRHTAGELRIKTETYLERLRVRGEALPGQIGNDGGLEINWHHLGRILDCAESFSKTGSGQLVRDYGLPIRLELLLEAPINGLLDGRPWRSTRISMTEAPQLARLLSTAALTLICYLSGARTGEVLSLRRECLEHDEVTGLWLMHGRYWKGAKDSKGAKIPEGQMRKIPWTVVDIVATAVQVLERLHPHELLFPTRLQAGAYRARRGKARCDSSSARDLNDFVAWVNAFCQHHGRTDGIVPDGRLNVSRFRRTLAWHIRRRPRGLVAASLQYGHLETRILQGYAGTAESGFPDDYAFEDWLFRIEILADDRQRLAAGEHVSGPAADSYRERVRTAATEFSGLVVTNAKRAKTLLADPRLQIYHGEGMTCVFNLPTAACQLRSTLGDSQSTPDIDDCRPNCLNLARTDRDIEHLDEEIKDLEENVADTLAPSIRHQRDQHELARLQSIRAAHEAGKDNAS